MVKKVFEIGMLYDFYGKLLTQKQRDFLELYYENDYTLSEIAENLNISRQAAFDTQKKVEKILHEYENKLGLIEKFEKNQEQIDEAQERLNVILNNIGNIDEKITQSSKKKAITELENIRINLNKLNS